MAFAATAADAAAGCGAGEVNGNRGRRERDCSCTGPDAAMTRGQLKARPARQARRCSPGVRRVRPGPGGGCTSASRRRAPAVAARPLAVAARGRLSSRCSASERSSGRPSSTTTSPASNRQSASGRTRARAAPAHAGDLHARRQLELGQRAADRVGAVRQHDGVQPRLQVLRRIRRVGGAVEEAAEEAVALLADGADALQHPRSSGTPSTSSECEASIRLPSSTSGTTSVAPAAISLSISLSSTVRTITGRSGRCALDVMQDLERHRRVGEGDRHRARLAPVPR